ncbi:MAG: Na(+)/H(+) antiporter subunit D [Kiloniellales bacterium]|nr:Na(+)/H(+) antiporter subunit D [Kiloniellales bacterium]
MTSVAPFLILFVGGALAAVTSGRLRQAVLLSTPVIGAINLYNLPLGTSGAIELFDYTLVLVRVDKLSLVFGYVFHLAALLAAIYALHVRDRVQHVGGTLYAGSSIGALFAGDLITLFIFWELTAITSVFLILARRTERAQATAIRYLAIQVLSGLFLVAGVLVWASHTGSIAFDYIGLDAPGGWLILIAFGMKSAFPLLHNWLTDAYPEATPTGTIFLSAFTTKLAVYTLARGYAGTEILVYIGATMTMFPIFYAVIENDLRRVLSYSLINQVGFMVTGVGIGTEMAINGAAAHAFVHIVYKALLFMSMGAVLDRVGTVDGSRLGGLYKCMPFTTVFCIIGAASISAFPLFSGFVAKSMVLTAALQEGYPIVWLFLLFASAGVFHHSGIKIPYFAFFAHDSGIRVKEARPNMLVAMFLASFICIFVGVYPDPLYSILPYPVEYQPYTAAHVLVQCQLLFFSALAFVFLQLTKLYPPELPGINIDSEWIYRWLLPRAARSLLDQAHILGVRLERGLRHGLDLWIQRVFHLHGPHSVLARTWQTGSTVMMVAALFAVVLLFSYL